MFCVLTFSYLCVVSPGTLTVHTGVCCIITAPNCSYRCAVTSNPLTVHSCVLYHHNPKLFTPLHRTVKAPNCQCPCLHTSAYCAVSAPKYSHPYMLCHHCSYLFTSVHCAGTTPNLSQLCIVYPQPLILKKIACVACEGSFYVLTRVCCSIIAPDCWYLCVVIVDTCVLWLLIPVCCDCWYLCVIIDGTCVLWLLIPVCCNWWYLCVVIVDTCVLWLLIPVCCVVTAPGPVPGVQVQNSTDDYTAVTLLWACPPIPQRNTFITSFAVRTVQLVHASISPEFTFIQFSPTSAHNKQKIISAWI